MKTIENGIPSGWFRPSQIALYQSFAQKVQDGLIVELGVWLGRSISTIVPICQKNGNQLVAVDLWQSVPNEPTYDNEKKKMGREPYDVFIENMKQLGYLDKMRVLRMDTVTAASLFDDNSCDLILIDADHAVPSVIKDIKAWRSKMKKGSVMLGHDFKLTQKGVYTIFPKDQVHVVDGMWWVQL